MTAVYCWYSINVGYETLSHSDVGWTKVIHIIGVHLSQLGLENLSRGSRLTWILSVVGAITEVAFYFHSVIASV